MLSRSNIIFLGMFLLAVVATVVVFAVSPGAFKDSTVSGKLSPELVAAESEFKAIQKEWNDSEKTFLELKPQTSLQLTALQGKLKKLSAKSKTLKGSGPAESDALPHLVASIDAMLRVTDPYIMRLLAPQRVGPKDWDRMKQDTKESNAEWEAWAKATRGLSR